MMERVPERQLMISLIFLLSSTITDAVAADLTMELVIIFLRSFFRLSFVFRSSYFHLGYKQ